MCVRVFTPNTGIFEHGTNADTHETHKRNGGEEKPTVCQLATAFQRHDIVVTKCIRINKRDTSQV